MSVTVIRVHGLARLSRGQAAGGLLLLATLAATVLAPVLSPNDPREQFADRAYAPPMRVRVWDGERVRMPFVYPLVLEDRLARVYRLDTAHPAAIGWLRDGRVWSVDRSAGPLLLLGADALGRDVFARVLYGAQISLAVAAIGVAGALVLGFIVGGMAGVIGGRVDAWLMAAADFVVILPAAYLVLVLRGAMPLALSTAQVFVLMAALFAVAAWPHVARGVRAIIASERRLEYAEASTAAGAGSLRLLLGLMPATGGFLLVETLLLLPALLVAEATVSYLGLGFAEPRASWGTLLQDAGNPRVMTEAPWLVAPAAAMFVVVLAIQLVGERRASSTVLRLAGAEPRQI